MQKKLSLVAATVVLLGLSACGLLPDKVDETKGWSASKLYSEASEELDGGHYARAISLFGKLESGYPFGTYSQQAQMAIAYAYYKEQDQAQALAAVERFIKLHPNHANVDYMYYLRGLINFNDQVGFLNFVYEQDPAERDPKATREAFASFKDLIEKFPNSKYTPDAIARMNIWSTPWPSMKSTWRAITTAAAPTWRRSTAPWAPSPTTATRRRSKRRCSS